jgi:hypothetical protein
LVGGEYPGRSKKCTGNSVKFRIIKKRIDRVYEMEQYFSKNIAVKILQLTGIRINSRP